ncbi:MAG: hypothetical protein E7581_08250 [Ruminococcaceae bacterium]|nr:hypothetical protein [Oscillospiraceae bacterium]
MNRVFRVLAALLAVLCVVAVFAACTPDTPAGQTTEQPTAAPETESESTTEQEPDDTPTVQRVPDERGLTDAQYSVLNIAGTDDFGRVILPVDGKVNKDRYVGMFYFLTLGQHTNHSGIYDVNKITYEGTYNKAFTRYNTPITPVGSAHFWGEPVWGYYNSGDTWVMRKQIEMLTMAGVDFLVLDTSNNVLYENVTAKLFEILKEYQDAGWDVPRVMYYLGKHDLGADMQVIKQVYKIFYESDTYKSLWFTPNDPEKPMIVAPDNVIASLRSSSNAQEKALAEFFDFRVTQWPIAAPVNEPVYEYGAPWISFEYPQTPQEGWINVSIAQHVSVCMTDTKASRGRGWYPTEKVKGQWRGKNDHENWRQNLNYQAQWNTVLEMTPEQRAEDARFVFLTGWNEWVAEKLRRGDGDYFTVDTFNPEYSRDIEPSRSSGMKDYAYFQTIMNIHADNYAPAVHYEYPAATPDITKDDAAVWQSAVTYRDFTGECADRNFKAMAGDIVYKDTTGRNDIDTISVLRNEQYLYFRISCAEDITAYSEGDTGWMNLWIKTADASGDLLCGYEYVINRQVVGNVSAVQNAKGESVGEADVNVFGKVMIVRIPLDAIGLDKNDFALEFKVTDNVQDMENDPLNLYSTGDAAPIGTLNFSFGY